MPASLLFILGLVIVVIGAELLLRGASALAAMMRISPMIIGLTVVSVGTSAPELAVGITAAAEGKGALAVGNIAGTNMVNILLILGLSAFIRPLKLRNMSIRFDVPVMIVAAVVLFLMALDKELSRLEGGILLAGAVAYTIALIRYSRRKAHIGLRVEYVEEYGQHALVPTRSWKTGVWNLIRLIVGISLTVWGADLLVSGAVDIAASLGVSDAIIGLTIVAIGTSAPELVTTMVATVKDDRDVAVGNLIGSSISNIVLILGATCLSVPGGITVTEDILWFDLPLAAAVAIACYPVFRSDKTVSRVEGGVFVLLYLIYLGTLIFLRT